MTTVNMSGQLPALQVNIVAKTRMNLSLHHLFAACRFASKIGDIERDNQGQPFGPFWEEIFHNAIGVATLSVASIECYANELFFESAAISGSLNPSAAAVISEVLDTEPILKKYSAVLAIRAGKALDLGVSEVQNADALVKLRNAIVHFRPEWFGEQDRHAKLSNQLRHKFQTSAFLSDEPIFPRAWASHSFAVWALRSSVSFIEHFHANAGIPNPLAQFRGHLTVLSANAL